MISKSVKTESLNESDLKNIELPLLSETYEQLQNYLRSQNDPMTFWKLPSELQKAYNRMQLDLHYQDD